MKKGNLYIVATPIGNLQDITFRAIEILKSVDLILAEDTRHTKILLNHFDILKPMQSYHKFNEKEKSQYIIDKLLNGENLALVSDAGTPGISDPGNVIIKSAIENDIDVIPIPGACAFVQSLICSGFDTTNFSFFGFLPTNNKDRKETLKKISTCSTNIILLYAAPHKLLNTLQDLKNNLGDIDICISKEITKLHENHFRTNISNAIEYYTNNTPKGEFVITLYIKEEIKQKNDLANENTQKLIIQKYTNLKDTYSLKDISKQLSKEFDLPKNELYNFLIQIKDTMEN